MPVGFASREGTRAWVLAAVGIGLGLGCARFGTAPDAPDASLQSSTSACPAGQKRCDGTCVDTDDPVYGCSETSCTRCSVPFASTLKCDRGRCAAATCQPGRAHCSSVPTDGCEADLLSPSTCGSCTFACPTDRPFCDGAACLDKCPPNTTDCNRSCVDLKTSATHCGGCGTACQGGVNASPACNNGLCGVGCNVGFGECDGNPANGCEELHALYADEDEDGYGAGPRIGEACGPGKRQAIVAGDCQDRESSVHPGQTAFFESPYGSADGQRKSFDYDCNGIEELGPGQTIGDCGQACRPGYAPTSTGAVPCGSRAFLQCGGVNQENVALPLCAVTEVKPAAVCH